MAVRDDWQGRGIGSALMSAAIDRADNWMNVLRIELTVQGMFTLKREMRGSAMRMDTRRKRRRMAFPFGVVSDKVDAALRTHPEGSRKRGRIAALPLADLAHQAALAAPCTASRVSCFALPF